MNMKKRLFLVSLILITLFFSTSFVFAEDTNGTNTPINTTMDDTNSACSNYIPDCDNDEVLTKEIDSSGCIKYECEDECPIYERPNCDYDEEIKTFYDSDGCSYPKCTPTIVACTEDAKICPDGSAVGRDPNNNCEFKDCPIIACTMQWDPVCAEVTTCTTSICEANDEYGNTLPNAMTNCQSGTSSCRVTDEYGSIIPNATTTCSGGVCYTEQKTYGNDCEAKAAGAKILYYGECDNSSIITESVKCVFDDSTNSQKCYLAGEENIGCNVTANEEACVVDVKKEKGKNLTWKSTCGGYAYTYMDGINEYAKFDCETNTGAVTEHVKCILDNAQGGEECYSEKGKCTVQIYGDEMVSTSSGNQNGTITSTNNQYRNQYGVCSMQIKGELGETVTWKSDCGGYAYTIMDGENEYANFACDSIDPPTIVEDNYKKAKWTCTNDLQFNKESNTCQPYSYWKNLAIRTCNQYSTKCGTTIEDVSTNNSSATTVTVTNSNTGSGTTTVAIDSNEDITKCIGGEVTVKEFDVGDKCESTCTSYKDSQGCTVTKCSDGIETVECSIESCRDQPIEEIRKIKEDCYEKNGRVIVEINEGNGCTHYNCVSEESSLNCDKEEDIPIEKKLDCEERGGRYIYNANSNGCLTVAECVGIKIEDRNINTQVIKDSTKLLELALKLESLKINLQETQAKIVAMANYYNTNNDSNSASNFTSASELLQTSIDKVDSLKEFIKENVNDFSEEDAKQVRVTIAEIKENILKEVLLEILG